MRDWPRIFFYQLVKIGGLVIAGHEVISGSPDPVVLMAAAAMMGSAQGLGMLDKHFIDPIINKNVKTTKIDKLELPQKELTWLEKAYRNHGIHVVPDAPVYEYLPEPFPDLAQFEADVTAALILDGKLKKNKRPIKYGPAQRALVEYADSLLRPETVRTPSGHLGTRGCLCSTPQVYASVGNVIFDGKSHIACWKCGRILDVDFDAFNERARSRWEQEQIDKKAKLSQLTREFSQPEESFMVDQIRQPIITRPPRI